MASAIYPKYKEALLGGDSNIALDSSTVKVSLIDSEEIVYSSTDQFYSDLNANGVISTATLSGVSVTDGVLDANDVVFSTVTGDECESIIIWIDTGTTTTSRLVAFLDSTNVIGLPVTPANTDITLQWSASGIFQL